MFFCEPLLAEKSVLWGADELLYMDIPGQPLASAIVELGVQANISIVVSVGELQGENGVPLVGYYSVLSALEALLAKTKLSYSFSGEHRSVKITRKPASLVSTVEKPVLNTQIDRIEEVFVVSARHRNEELLSVPISLSVISEQFITDNNINDLTRAGLFSPNTLFKIHRALNASLGAYIRGVGLEDPVAGVETSVGIYVDDVYINRPQSVILDIYDAERIEILRGPQGTLYGRNTIGGAIKYVTKKMDDVAYFSIRGAVGSYNQRDVVVSGGMPVRDIVKIGGSFASLTRDGFGKNLVTGAEHYNKAVSALRSTVEISFSDSFLVRISADVSEDNSEIKSGYSVSPEVGDASRIGRFDTRSGISNTEHPLNESSAERKGISGNINWSFSESWALKVISAVRSDRSESPSDLDSLEEVISDAYTLYDNDQYSQEFRLTFDADHFFWMVGGYYLSAKSLSAHEIVVSARNIRSPFITDDIVSFLFSGTDVKSTSLFSSFNLSLGQAFKASLGGRYIKENRKATVEKNLFYASSSGALVTPYFGGDGQSVYGGEAIVDGGGTEVWPEFVGARSDSVYTPQLTISWVPSLTQHYYFSYSEGFKGGGFAPRGFYVDTRVREGFDPESVGSYELGAKFLFWDETISMNTSFFYNDYRDMQVLSRVEIDSITGGTIRNNITSNAKKARIQGAELEIHGSYGPYSADLAFGVIDARFIDYVDWDGRDLSHDREFVSTPESVVGLSLGYTKPFAGGNLFSIFSLHSQSEVTYFSASSDLVDQAGYTLYRINLGWNSNSWSVGLYGDNISNKKYTTGAFYQSAESDSLGADGTALVFWGEPRTFTLKLEYRY